MRNYADTKAGKLAGDRFNKRVEELLVSMGATVVRHGSMVLGEPTNLTLHTRAGPLHFSLYGDWIAARFDDVDAARRVLGQPHHRLNPHSGKFNWQGTRLTWTPAKDRKPEEDEVVASMESELRPLLPTTEGT